MANKPRTPESVLKTIVEASSGVKGRAALSHYPSRRLWAARLHERLTASLDRLKKLQEVVAIAANEVQGNSEREKPNSRTLFVQIVPVLLKHHAELLQSLLSASHPLPTYQMGDT